MQYTGAAGSNLFGSCHPFAKVLREADTFEGHFVCRPGFAVVVSTHLSREDFPELLSRALPMNQLQAILPTVSERPCIGVLRAELSDDSSDSHTQRVASLTTLDSTHEPEKKWTLEDAQAASLRMMRKVQQMRERRGSN